MTQDDLSGMICVLFPVHTSQMMSFPSSEHDTTCLQQSDGFMIHTKAVRKEAANDETLTLSSVIFRTLQLSFEAIRN